MQHDINEFIFAYLEKLGYEITSRKPILHLELDSIHHIGLTIRIKLVVIVVIVGVEDDVVERGSVGTRLDLS